MFKDYFRQMFAAGIAIIALTGCQHISPGGSGDFDSLPSGQPLAPPPQATSFPPPPASPPAPMVSKTAPEPKVTPSPKTAPVTTPGPAATPVVSTALPVAKTAKKSKQPAPAAEVTPSPTPKPAATKLKPVGDPSADKPGSAAEGSDTFENLELVDSSLGSKLAVTRVGSDRTPINMLSVYAGLKNKTAKPLQIEVQTIYKDSSDTPLSGFHGSWIPIKLKPHEETVYRSVSISADAVDFMIRVRKPVAMPPTLSSPITAPR